MAYYLMMRFLLLLIILIPLTSSFASEKEILDLLLLPEEKLDIGIAALTIAKDVYPDLDVKAYSAKIDAMAKKAKMLTKGSKDPDYRVRALNTYLYQIEDIKYNLSDPYTKELQNRYLNGILDTKKGSCVTMPLLYLAIAQRLGYPVYAVAAPWHIFIRYVDPNLKMQNIEATGGGGYVPDDEYIEVMQISESALKSGTYLRTMSYREYIADMVGELAVYWDSRGDLTRAIEYLEKCAKINPISAEINNTLGRAYLKYSRMAEGKASEEYRSKAKYYIKRAEELGLSKLSNKNYTEEQRKAQEKYRTKHKL